MPRLAHEIALHCSLYASSRGYAVALFVQSCKRPATGYRYQLAAIDTSEEFTPDKMTKAIVDAWHKNYTDPDMRRLGVCPINHLYCNTLQYKQDVRRQFAIAKQQGYQGHTKPLPSEWPFYQVRRWELVEGLSGDILASALRNLSAVINQRQLFAAPDIIQKLQDEMNTEFDWDVGIKSMPLLLAAFVQAFSQLPLKREATAAQAYLRGGFV